jgi:predicted signal transduction protein with EAL and GGDEF domain
VQHEANEIPVTASFGVAGYPESTGLRDGLFPAADRALYVAKDQGRNCVSIAASVPKTGGDQPVPEPERPVAEVGNAP